MNRSDGLRPISDSVIVLTGASSGIGRATALELAERGARLVLAARSDGSLEAAAADCKAAGAEVLTVPTDVSNESDVSRLAHQALERFGRIDVWINDAAVMAYGRLDEIPVDVFRQVIDTNLHGTVHGARAAIPLFRERGSGTLINVSSLYAKLTSPLVSPYVTSKYAVLGFTRCLREELADEPDVHICLVLPEAVDTPIFHHAANYTGSEVVALPPAMDPQRVVDAIVGCIEDPQPEITVGVTGRLMTVAQRTFRRLSVARLYDRLASAAMHAVALRDEPAADSPGNVFDPQPEKDRIDGGWREQRRTARTVGAVGVAAVLAGPVVVWWRSRNSG